MRLVAVTIKLFRNFVDAQRIEIEPDVTCLVGKNESGKSTILKALHRLKPANGDQIEFDLTTEYPRWRLAQDKRTNASLAHTRPIVAEFALDREDRTFLADYYDVALPEGTLCWSYRDYTNSSSAWLSCSVDDAARHAAAAVDLADADLQGLNLLGSLESVVAAATMAATEHREAGEIGRAKSCTAFAAAMQQYDSLVDATGPIEGLGSAVWDRIPSFFYFSNYDTLPGETNLTSLTQLIAAGEELSARQRTVVSLLAHAGEKPSDFLDENYDSRKAELQSASIDLSRRVFKYWKQNKDLSVIFDTDNRIVQTDRQGNDVANRFLKIELRDGRHGDVETNFDTRSTGFQWFFSFFAAFSSYQHSEKPVVVLLDEPGTSLHGDAQHEFVDYIFDELGAVKQTLYTTHSQHMVDPTRYEKLRAVHDRATRADPDLGVSVAKASLTTDSSTLLPIESALGYSVSRHLFLGSGHHLAVEGSGDYVYLQRMTEHLVANGRSGLDPRLSVIPVGGITNMPAFVALLGRRLKVSALVDGARTTQQLARVRSAAVSNGVPESAIVACSDIAGMPSNADIEDLFDTADYLRLYNWVFGERFTASMLAATSEPVLKKMRDLRGDDFDHALPAHELTGRRDEFFASVSEQTLGNFEALFVRLNATL